LIEPMILQLFFFGLVKHSNASISEQNAKTFFKEIQAIKDKNYDNFNPNQLNTDVYQLRSKHLQLFKTQTHNNQDICEEDKQALKKVLEIHEINKKFMNNTYYGYTVQNIGLLVNDLLALQCNPLSASNTILEINDDETPLELALKFNDGTSVSHICLNLKNRCQPLPMKFQDLDKLKTGQNTDAIKVLCNQVQSWENHWSKFSTEMDPSQLCKFIYSKNNGKPGFYDRLRTAISNKQVTGELLFKMDATQLYDFLSQSGYHASEISIAEDVLLSWMGEDSNAREIQEKNFIANAKFDINMEPTALKFILERTDVWNLCSERLKSLIVQPNWLKNASVLSFRHFDEDKNLGDYGIERLMTICGNEELICKRLDQNDNVKMCDHELFMESQTPFEMMKSESSHSKNMKQNATQEYRGFQLEFNPSFGKNTLCLNTRRSNRKESSFGVGFQSQNQSSNMNKSHEEFKKEKTISIKTVQTTRKCKNCNYTTPPLKM